jgi:hypothetical protein
MKPRIRFRAGLWACSADGKTGAFSDKSPHEACAKWFAMALILGHRIGPEAMGLARYGSGLGEKQ